MWTQEPCGSTWHVPSPLSGLTSLGPGLFRRWLGNKLSPSQIATTWTLGLAGHTPQYLGSGCADKSILEHTTFSPPDAGIRTHHFHLSPPKAQKHKRTARWDQHAGRWARRSIPAHKHAGAQVRSSSPPSLRATHISIHTGDHTHPHLAFHEHSVLWVPQHPEAVLLPSQAPVSAAAWLLGSQLPWLARAGPSGI